LKYIDDRFTRNGRVVGWQEFKYDNQDNVVSITRCRRDGIPKFSMTWEYDGAECVQYKDSKGFSWSTENLPNGILCQVFKHDKLVLEIKRK
jgi:hypothetical protein